jgi:hypothetical protein
MNCSDDLESDENISAGLDEVDPPDFMPEVASHTANESRLQSSPAITPADVHSPV